MKHYPSVIKTLLFILFVVPKLKTRQIFCFNLHKIVCVKKFDTIFSSSAAFPFLYLSRVCMNFFRSNFSGKQSLIRLKNPSADRNCQPILDCLLKILDRTQPGLKLLEISSGTGQHISYISPSFPNITFYPSEYETSMFGSIRAFTESQRNVELPMTIDIRRPFGKWNWLTVNLVPTKVSGTFDYMLNINMIHITPWECTEGLFKNASGLLKPNGIMLTYGPFASNGILIPESNVNFDQYLRSTNPEWGVRDLRDLQQLASTYGINLEKIFDMPANNKICVWRKNPQIASSTSS